MLILAIYEASKNLINQTNLSFSTP